MRAFTIVALFATSLGACAKGRAVDITVDLDPATDPVLVARIRSLDFDVGGAEQAHVNRQLPSGLHKNERIVYTPTVVGGVLTVAVVARDEAGAALLSGSAQVTLSSGITSMSVPLHATPLVADPPAVAFGDALVGSTSMPTTVTIRNVANKQSESLAVAIVGDQPDQLSVVVDDCAGRLLAPDETCAIGVAFRPQATGGATASLRVGASAAAQSSITLTGTGLDPGVLAILPLARDFGAIPQGQQSSDLELVVTNTGESDTGVLAVSLTGDSFAIGSDQCTGTTLAAAQSCSIRVHFAPQSLGPKAATLTVHGDPGGNAIGMLRGTSVAPAAIAFLPTPYDFGTVDTGSSSAVQVFTLTNNGAAATGAIGVTYVGDTSQFTVAGDQCSNVALPAGASCTVSMKFTPSSYGSAALTINAGGAPGGMTSATLTGTGRSYTTLTVHVAGVGSGSVAATGLTCTGATCSGTYPRIGPTAPTVMLTGTPATGSLLTWSGDDCTGSVSPCNLTLDTNKIVTATFNIGQYALTVTDRFIAGASGSVSSSVGGINCGAACNASYAYNSPVTLTATASNGFLFQSWWGACSGTQPTCDLHVTGAMDVTATFRPKINYAFTTSTTYVPGQLGGITGADNACQARADAAGLGGKYVALISTSTVNASARIASYRGWLRPDGRVFADTPTTLFMQWHVYYPLVLDEFGAAAADDYGITGSDQFGNASNGLMCNDWTDAAGRASLGPIYAGGSEWFTNYGGGCDSPDHLYCVETDYTAPVTVPDTAGMVIFVSKNTFDPSTGIAAADKLCTDDAAAAGLYSPTKFKAVLSSLGVSAASRFRPVNATSAVVRPDGTFVSTTETNFFNLSPLLAATGERADKTINASDNNIFTGVGAGNDLTDPGTAEMTCNNWSTSAATAYGGAGDSMRLLGGSRGGFQQSCDHTYLHVLCLGDP